MILLMLTLLYPPGWSDDKLVTIDTANTQGRADIEIDSANASWIVWEDSVTFGTAVLFYSRRDEAGNILIPPTHLAYNNTKVYFPRVGIDSSQKVHFIWRDIGGPTGFGLWHAKLDLDGTILVPPHQAVIGYGGLPPASMESNFVIDNKNRLHVVWDQKKPEDNECGIYYSQLDSLGDSIITVRVIPPDTWAIYPSITIDSDYNLQITMRALFSGPYEGVGYVKLNDQGQILIPLRCLTSGDRCTGSEITVDRADYLYVAYTRNLPDPYGPSVYLMKLDKEGNILWDDTVYVNYNWSAYPGDIAIDEKQQLHLVWFTTSPGWEIYYATLDTAGNFLVDTVKIVYGLTNAGAEYSRIATDSADLARVCWDDTRGGGSDVYYKWQLWYPGVFEQPERSQKPTLFPSPASRLEIRLNKKTKLEIYDVMGRRVFKTTGHPPVFTWQPQRCPSGVYFVRLGNRTYPFVLLR